MSTEARIEEIFRRSSAALVAALTRAFGPSRLDLVEAVVQDAFVRALTEWKDAPPQNPEGWLLSVARNLAIDQVRRERTLAAKESAIAYSIESSTAAAASSAWASPSEVTLRGEMADDLLATIFVACHPVNSVPSQVALALRTLCGFEIPAIARALYASEEAIEKRLVLARRRLREAEVSFDLPSADEHVARLEAVLAVLYLMFNEAYCGTAGPEPIDEEIAAESVRLASFLARHPSTARPEVFALLALMHFHASRFPARLDARGGPLTLPEQDRSLWDQGRIALGLEHLAASAQGARASKYHYEAAIAAVHATSASHGETDWARLVEFYDSLVRIDASPSARLARVIALGFRDGPRAALDALDALSREPIFGTLCAFHAARADAALRVGDAGGARDAFEQARARATSAHELAYFERRLAAL